MVYIPQCLPQNIVINIIGLGLVLNGHNLSKHDCGVSVKESNTGETLARLEGVDNQWLGWLKDNLSHLVSLKGVWGLHLLSSSLLSDLPVNSDDLASRASATNESDWRVSWLGLSWDIKSLNLGSEVLDWLQGGVRLQDHDISGTWEVVLVKSLDVHSDIVSWSGLLGTLVVHLDSEDLSDAWVGSSVGWHEDNLISWLDNSLLNTSSKNISNSLDLVSSRDWKTEWGISVTLWHLDKSVQSIKECVDVHLISLWINNVNSGPPSHVGGLGDKVVSHPSRDWKDWHRVLDKVWLPSDLAEHMGHLVTDLLITSLLVSSNIRVHLVDSDNELLNSQKVDKTSVLAGLSLDLSSLVVSLLDSGGEVTVSWNHEKAHISLGSSGNHVLDEISVSWGINDGVVPLLSVELLGGARDGHTTSTLLLLSIHIESKGERRLSEGSCLFLELLQLTLWDTAELEEKASSGGGLTGIDVSADNCNSIQQ